MQEKNLDQAEKYGATVPLRLNMGGGSVPLDGFINIDRHTGGEVYPVKLKFEKSEWSVEDGEVDEIYASHVLEHFDHVTAPLVIKEWVRVLKPGGRIRIAVPDFKAIAERYLKGEELPIAGYVCGGQTDENDYHKTIFDEEYLADLMTSAGLVDIKPWKSELDDCAALPISLNLEGDKPLAVTVIDRPIRRVKIPKTVAIMSMPRVAITANMFSALNVCFNRGVLFEKVEGVFWGQCLTRGIESHLEDGTEWIVVVDYDSVFTDAQFDAMAELMITHPEADAIAPLQIKRDDNHALMGVVNPDGSPLETDTVPPSFFDSELTRCKWAHFGLTFIRVSALKRMKKPWFEEKADPNGSWNEGRVDCDIAFWSNFVESGNKLYLANKVPLGHAQLVYTWPREDFKATHQYSGDYIKVGIPEKVRGGKRFARKMK